MARLTRANDGLLVRAMDEILDERLSDLDLQIRAAVDASTCPVALLPWLAWHRGLPHFSSAWPEHIQRAAVAGARVAIRERGTKAGIVGALEDLGSAVQLIEWHEEAATPGEWRVVVTVDDELETDQSAQDEIAEVLRRMQPVSRPWTLEVGLSVSGGSVIASHLIAASYWHVTSD